MSFSNLPYKCMLEVAPSAGPARDRNWLRALGILGLLFLAHLPSAVADNGVGAFCQSKDGSTSSRLETLVSPELISDVRTVRALVKKLREAQDMSLSFIEVKAEEPLSLPPKPMSLDELLREVAKRHEHYRCEIYNGRLVLRSSDPIFDVIVTGVTIANKPRGSAQRAYVDHLRSFDERFKTWESPLIAIAGMGPWPTLTDPVTLTPRAPLVQHLMQLCGRDEAVYFDVPAPDSRGRTIHTAAVCRQWHGRICIY